MEKSKKGFNPKARQSTQSSSKRKEIPKVAKSKDAKIDIEVREEKYDSNNPFLLPSDPSLRKKKEKELPAKQKKKKELSKSQKRRLARVIAKKQSNINRAEILEKLQKVQATPAELNMMTSTSFMQTYGIKRNSDGLSKQDNTSHKISNVKGANKNKDITPRKRLKQDPTIAGISDSEDSEVESDNEEGECIEVKEVTNSNAVIEANFVPVVEIDSKSKETKMPESLVPPIKNVQDSDKIPEKPKVPAVFIPVKRSPEVQAIREALPIYTEEQTIMEAIHDNPVVVIHGATGCGKTTQVPQFLYEAGYTRDNKIIGITEPRRIAAIQMSSRVGEEMNLPDAVSYHIRYENTSTEDKTEVKFMTDGVLLKEMRRDFFLKRYSVIIIDEAHERSIFSDVLIGLLSRVIRVREEKGIPLKLIIMSATLRVEDFIDNTKLFKQKPVLITLDSRQYDVVIHFSKKTPDDYVKAAYEKVRKIHCQLPTGAILVFATGEKEVTRLCKLLRKAFPFKNSEKKNETSDEKEKSLEKDSSRRKNRKQNKDIPFSELLPEINLDEYSIEPLDYEGLQHQNSDDEGLSGEDECDAETFGSLNSSEPLYVLPLYSVLPTDEQAKVFRPPPPGCRLCVVATNVAETSVTIPGLKYVVDTGKVKTRVYDKIASGVSAFVITWTSKASADQRAGRAGRTEGGHCYRLYSSTVFEHEFPDHTPPDIQRIPIDDILLQMKALGIDRVVNFPFPTSPDVESLKAAEKRLVNLGALHNLQQGQRYKDIAEWEYSAKCTQLGKAMSRFPLSPRFAKMLLFAYKYHVIPHMIAIVSALTVPEVFLMSTKPTQPNEKTVEEEKVEEEKETVWIGIKKIGAGHGKSKKLADAMVLLRAVAVFEESQNQSQFCHKYNIRHKAMVEIHKMRLQLIREMNRSFYDLDLPVELTLPPPTEEMIDKLRKVIVSGLIDHVARKIPDEVQKEGENLKDAYRCLDLEEPVFIHPSSILAKQPPEFIVYQDIFQTSRYYMRTVIDLEPEWLATLAPNQCQFSAPLETPAPYYDSKEDCIMCSMTATFGRFQWDLPCITMPMPQGILKHTWFCFLFLDGQICPPLQEYKKHLMSAPNVMLKQWARLLPRTRTILQAIADKEIDSREKLYQVWEDEPKYLLDKYSEWLPQSKHLEVSLKWPPKK